MGVVVGVAVDVVWLPILVCWVGGMGCRSYRVRRSLRILDRTLFSCYWHHLVPIHTPYLREGERGGEGRGEEGREIGKRGEGRGEREEGRGEEIGRDMM